MILKPVWETDDVIDESRESPVETPEVVNRNLAQALRNAIVTFGMDLDGAISPKKLAENVEQTSGVKTTPESIIAAVSDEKLLKDPLILSANLRYDAVSGEIKHGAVNKEPLAV